MDKGLGTSFFVLGDWLSGSLSLILNWAASLVLLPIRVVAGLFMSIEDSDQWNLFPL